MYLEKETNLAFETSLFSFSKFITENDVPQRNYFFGWVDERRENNLILNNKKDTATNKT